MKLFYSPTSPYVRKVLACAITRGIADRIERIPTNPHVSPPSLLAHNPLSKVPCLITDDGVALFDSPVICEYLDDRGDALPLFPGHGALRWRALKLQATGDGILDAAVSRRLDQGRPTEEARTTRWSGPGPRSAGRSTSSSATRPRTRRILAPLPSHARSGISIFGFRMIAGASGRPQLDAWHAAFSQQPGLAADVPADPA